jgi:SAM-dependent methyltransferase
MNDHSTVATAKVSLPDLARRLAKRDAGAEANLQADVRTLLLYGGLNLGGDDLVEVELEAQVGGGRRIDIETGFTVIETKRNLRHENIRVEAEEQLAGYVRDRATQLGQRYVGILTDGADWRLYHLSSDDALHEVSRFELSPTTPDHEALTIWLEGALATVKAIKPTPREIERRLGAVSSAHALDYADLAALYAEHRENATVKLKRELWARLLRTAFGASFDDDDRLFVEHSLLVAIAEVIAHAVVGLNPTTLAPATVLSGQQFAQAGISGVVEEDFFDWVIEVPGGERFVRSLARRLMRFSWGDVEHDVMKVLYESVIDTDQRHRLGEYYTPDWLAERLVAEVVDAPLEQRVLDPACGSGTFLFHAVRHYLGAADEAYIGAADAITGATRHVLGIDVHPLAVTFARVTYLLAIGLDLLQAPERPNFHVPVFLGDSLQWRTPEANLWTKEGLTITVDDGAQLWDSDLHFPSRLLDDAGQFDRLVDNLADRAADRTPGSRPPSLAATFTRFGIHEDDQAAIAETFATMCRLHDDGRDHVWAYYVRNLARPVWLNRPENHVDRLVGNPPWLAYRFMTADMQATFRQMSEERGLWAGASVATHQDLSGLFLIRAVELYLKTGGRFGFVMPLATLSRGQFAGFRTGHYNTSVGEVAIAFDAPWDLHKVKPNLFRVPPSVILGEKTSTARALPGEAEHWSGRVSGRNISWEQASGELSQAAAGVHVARDAPSSLYHSRFSQGASLVPRMLLIVEPAPSSPIGVAAGRRAIRSARSANEKPPWKHMPALDGSVESEFVRPVHVGATILPFRTLDPLLGVIPRDKDGLMSVEDSRLDLYPGLASWWRDATSLWEEHKAGNHLAFNEQVNFRNKLSMQFPTAPHRVVYTKGGQYLAAAHLDNPQIVVDHTLYWATVSGPEEARYLMAVLNSSAITKLVAPLQARGEHNPRHFDKYIWRLPIPLYDTNDERHQQLVELARRAEVLADETDLQGAGTFQAQRRRIREALESSGLGGELNALVVALIEPTS